MIPLMGLRATSLAVALFAGACALAPATPAWAQVPAQAPAGDMSFDAVAQAAVSAAPSVKVKRRELDAAEHGVDAARWGRYPALSFNVSSRTVSGTGPSGTGSNSTVRLEQPLYAWGGIEGRIRAAEQQRSLAVLGVQTETNAVLDRVITAYAQFQQAQGRLVIQQAALVRLRDYQAMIGRRLLTQYSSRNDEALVIARVLQAQSDIASSQAALERARAQLEELTAQPVVEVLPASTDRRGLLSLAQVESTALDASTEIASARIQRDAADTDVEVKRADALPRVVARYDRTRAPSIFGGSQNYNQVYVAIEANFGNGLSLRDVVSQAMSRKDAAEQQIETAQRSISQQVRSAWADATAYAEQLPALEDVTQKNKEVVESFLRQYLAGRKSWLDVLNSERELTQSQLSAVDIRAQAGMSVHRLLRLAGELPAQTAAPVVPTAADSAPDRSTLIGK